MKFEDLQQQWRNVQIEPKSHDEIRKMMYSSPGSLRLRDFTRKELTMIALELAICPVGFYLSGWTWHWYDVIYILWFVFYVLYKYIGLRYWRVTPQEETMRKTITNALIRVKRMVFTSLIIQAILWILLAIILGMEVYLGRVAITQWFLILLGLLSIIWWLTRNWTKKADELKALLQELSDEPVAVV